MSGLGLELAGGGSDEAKAACITSSRSDSSLGSILPRPTKREQSELPSIDQLEKVEDVYGHRNRQPPLHSSALCTLHSALCTLHLDCLRRPLPDHSLQVARPGWRRPRVARGCSPDHLSLSPCHDKSSTLSCRHKRPQGDLRRRTRRKLPAIVTARQPPAPSPAARITTTTRGLHGGSRSES
jgi:hypothetical protein